MTIETQGAISQPVRRKIRRVPESVFFDGDLLGLGSQIVYQSSMPIRYSREAEQIVYQTSLVVRVGCTPADRVFGIGDFAYVQVENWLDFTETDC